MPFFLSCCREVSDVHVCSSEAGNYAGFKDTCIVRKVVCVCKCRAFSISEYVLDNESCESTGECNDDLIFVNMSLKSFCIVLMSECRAYKKDDLSIADSCVDIVCYQIEFSNAVNSIGDSSLSDNCLSVEYSLHVMLELRELEHLNSMSL